MTEKYSVPSFSSRLDAVVLAGTHRDSTRSIRGKNKALLDIDGRPLIRHVVDALLGAESIGSIFAVGPLAELGHVLESAADDVHLVPQEGNMLTNCWAGVHASERLHDGDGKEAALMRPVLIISCDLPLISAYSIDDFVARCADDDRASETPCALMVGLADENGLKPFRPEGDKPGIIRPFVELEFARIRLANIYVARPRQLIHQEFLQTGFFYRKAVDWRNVVGLAFSILSQAGGLQSAWLTLRLQATLLASRRGGRLYRFLRRGNTRERLEACASKVLGSPLRLVITPFGGLSLDVDDEEDLKVLTARYRDWIAIHEATRPDYSIRHTTDKAAG